MSNHPKLQAYLDASAAFNAALVKQYGHYRVQTFQYDKKFHNAETKAAWAHMDQCRIDWDKARKHVL